jgi:hypothetical protein
MNHNQCSIVLYAMDVNWVWRSVFKSERYLSYRGLGSDQFMHTSVLLRKYNLKTDIVFCFCFFCSQYLQHCKIIYVHLNIMIFSSWNKHWLWFIGASPYYTTNICMSMRKYIFEPILGQIPLNQPIRMYQSKVILTETKYNVVLLSLYVEVLLLNEFHQV